MAKLMAAMAPLKRLSGKHRLLLAALAVAVAAGFAGGIVLASGNAGTSAGPPGVLASGQFKTISWGTRGKAMLVRDASGHLALRFDTSFSTRQAPELYVYLDQRNPGAHRGPRGKTLLVGTLANSIGGQHYDLPASAAHMTGYTVEVYCGECDKTQGVAQLQPAAPGTS
jgi:electron transfer DM13